MNGMNLKQMIREAAEHYERHAERERERAEKMTDGCMLQMEIKESYQFNRGRAKAMREALELIEEVLG